MDTSNLELITETASEPIKEIAIHPAAQKALQESADIASNLPEPKFLNQINESVGGYVLGKFSGVFFKPDAVSGNKRFYSYDLWSSCINSAVVQEKLARGMVGTYEHPTTPTFTTPDGQMTTKHPYFEAMVTKSLKIVKTGDGYLGLGEAYILNTPLGLILTTLLKATDESGNPLVKMFVSSRAWASASSVDEDGIKILDPDNFFLESFDATRFPGVKEAAPNFIANNPGAAESINNESFIEDYIKGFKSSTAKVYFDSIKRS